MTTHFEFGLPPVKYSKKTERSASFKNDFGTWIVNVVSPGNHMLCGTIILEPAFDKTLINPKLVKIIVERKDTRGNRYDDKVVAAHQGQLTFIFGPFQSTKTDGYFFGINIKVEMPPFTCNDVTKVVEEVGGVKEYMKKLFETGNAADVTIKLGEKEVKAHKLVLLRSEVFEKMLSDSSDQFITIEDMKQDVFTEMCRFLYYDDTHTVKEHAIDLLEVAEKFMLQDLAAKCERFLKANITMDNYHEILTVADKLNKTGLQDIVINFMSKNRNTIFASDSWKELKKNNVQLAMLFFEKLLTQR